MSEEQDSAGDGGEDGDGEVPTDDYGYPEVEAIAAGVRSSPHRAFGLLNDAAENLRAELSRIRRETDGTDPQREYEYTHALLEFAAALDQIEATPEGIRDQAVQACRDVPRDVDGDGISPLKNSLRSQFDQYSAQQDDRPELRSQFTSNVDRVEKRETAEAKQSAEWWIYFDGKNKPLVFDSTAEWADLDEVKDQWQSTYNRRPFFDGGDEDDGEQWSRVIDHVMNSAQIEVDVIESEASLAVESLRSRVSALPAFLSADQAAEQEACLIEAPSEDVAAGEGTLWVHRSVVQSVAEEHGVEENNCTKLRRELGHLKPGKSRPKTPNERFWPLLREADEEGGTGNGFREDRIVPEHEYEDFGVDGDVGVPDLDDEEDAGEPEIDEDALPGGGEDA